MVVVKNKKSIDFLFFLSIREIEYIGDKSRELSKDVLIIHINRGVRLSRHL